MLDLTELSFYGSEFDRAAHLRSKFNNTKIESIAKNLIIWRGKILIDQNNFSLVYLSSTHPLIKHSNVPPIFLGQVDKFNYFAHDISNWNPKDLPDNIKPSFIDQTSQSHPDLPFYQNFNDLRFIMTQLSDMDAGLASTAKALFSWHNNNTFCSKCGNETVSTQSGWQRDCNKCNTSQYPRTDPVVIMLITLGNKILLGRSPQWPEKMYSCLAGFIEPGETMEAAVAREVKEETNIDISHVNYVISQPWAFPSSLMLGCMAKAITREITIDQNELEDAQWVSKDVLLKAYAGYDVGITPARPGTIAEFLIQNWVKGTLTHKK